MVFMKMVGDYLFYVLWDLLVFFFKLNEKNVNCKLFCVFLRGVLVFYIVLFNKFMNCGYSWSVEIEILWFFVVCNFDFIIIDWFLVLM